MLPSLLLAPTDAYWFTINLSNNWVAAGLKEGDDLRRDGIGYKLHHLVESKSKSLPVLLSFGSTSEWKQQLE
ncbi:hypothetical protein R1flu_013943 [Riccia fluitans]|uniref:Uncharacterized protein n=1 Tax=Riccia fluitans TaxID=41844 RepID=A0ABD1YIF2_9MARC